MTDENKIRVICITPNSNGNFSVESLMIGNKERHFAKKLTGDYQGKLDHASLMEAGLNGEWITWVWNGLEGQRKNRDLIEWTLPGLDFSIYGKAYIYRIRNSVRDHTSVSVRELADLIGRAMLAFSRRNTTL